jgi:hypothetical protein
VTSTALPAAQALRAIHDNDVEGLQQLLVEYPALLSWRGDESQDGLLGFATGAYGDSFDQSREEWFTRAASAELLIDAGAVVMPSVCEGILESRARGLLELFHRKGLLPRTLKFLAALDDLDAVRAALDENGNDLTTVNEAFMIACRFQHEAVASLLLDRAIALDPELGTQIDARTDRGSFIRSDFGGATAVGPWQAFVMGQVSRALGDGALTPFIDWLQREPWLLGEGCVEFQAGLIGAATLNDRGEFITALLDLDPAILRRQPPPPSQAIEFAITYAHTHLVPLLTRIWPVPDDLPHAAGMGSLSRVKHWFDESGAPVLGDVGHHYPSSPYMPKSRVEEYALQWGALREQHVLDVALAFAVINGHFDIADFLLEHGANINTTWNSHEPASILHHLVFYGSQESMRFLIDRGIDMTIKDHRWNSTAQGWARYGKKDETLAQWLEEAERQRSR